ncbi:hypothetical protein C2W62_34305 [Candidatus Entotheonella serta]|nr:hypothetical protein C2W62_34305 [Candidatus Entotheonella serta]
MPTTISCFVVKMATRSIRERSNNHSTKAIRNAGLPHIRLHDACHTCETLLLEQGVAAKIAQTILGHGSIAMTLDTYSHVSMDLEKRAVAKLDEALAVGLQ